ncbi:hypothetical protein Tsubulata_049981 [Turnera subulata]|uniref:Uncharacterized protein n=1 Tax=Turnera subulata TaxID=218843 RepID=A0A9Q0J2J5_9ROSI|nr:hypothetical protein Tsubulata_049981 [Turnera subulata]
MAEAGEGRKQGDGGFGEEREVETETVKGQRNLKEEWRRGRGRRQRKEEYKNPQLSPSLSSIPVNRRSTPIFQRTPAGTAHVINAAALLSRPDRGGRKYRVWIERTASQFLSTACWNLAQASPPSSGKPRRPPPLFLSRSSLALPLGFI